MHGVQAPWPAKYNGTYAQGVVSLRILISRTGTVKDIEVVSAPAPEFAASAMGAVSQWIYAPILRQGRPVETITTVYLTFAIRRP